MTDTLNLESFNLSVKERVDSNLKKILTAKDPSPAAIVKLYESMQYSVLGGGKRIRPVLCFASALLFDKQSLSNQAVLASASALELIHAYSLVHDDLPAMDDDDLRRGRPTTHIQYDDATAILAGDALQTLAFETLINAENFDPENKLTAINLLAKSSGALGMVGGQMIDLQSVGQALSLEKLMQMHSLKTGALIKASVLMGAVAAGCKDSSHLKALEQYSEQIGLAFQIQDDILDCTAETGTLGKQQGADIERGKPTYVSLLGLEGAGNKLAESHQKAISAIKKFSDNTLLVHIADYIVGRTH